MRENKYICESIGNLIQVNFERMAAFDKAAKTVEDAGLKNYFEAKANESERNIEELQQVLSEVSFPHRKLGQSTLLPASNTFAAAVYQNRINIIIDTVKCLEMHMMEWYQQIGDGLSNIPGEFKNLLKQQLLSLKTGYLHFRMLTSTIK